jgi:hypothetical protein
MWRIATMGDWLHDASTVLGIHAIFTFTGVRRQ